MKMNTSCIVRWNRVHSLFMMMIIMCHGSLLGRTRSLSRRRRRSNDKFIDDRRSKNNMLDAQVLQRKSSRRISENNDINSESEKIYYSNNFESDNEEEEEEEMSYNNEEVSFDDDHIHGPINGVKPHPDFWKKEELDKDEGIIDSSTLSYLPGDFTGNLKSTDGDLRLCNGLKATLIAQSGERIQLSNDSRTESIFLSQPNGGAIFTSERGGGWTYLMNSNSYLTGDDDWWSGGVGALDFKDDGSLVGYRRLLSGTSLNNGGGKTPWNTWITCEYWSCRQVDPMMTAGESTATADATTPLLGLHTKLSAFAYYYDTITDISNTTKGAYPWFFLSRNDANGALTRFIPDEDGEGCFDSEEWCTLQNLNHDYLVLNANANINDDKEYDGVFRWSSNLTAASESAFHFFQNANHLTVNSRNGILYITSKTLGNIICLYLKTGLFKIYSKIKDLLAEDEHDYFFFGGGNDDPSKKSGISSNTVFFFPYQGGISGRNDKGEYFNLLYPDNARIFSQQTAAAATTTATTTTNIINGGTLSPDGKHLYVVYEESGRIYDVERIDGEPFLETNNNDRGLELLELTQSMLY